METFWERITDPLIDPKKLETLCELRETISNASGTQGQLASVNFVAICFFVGLKNAQKLLTPKGTLYIPPGRSAPICKKIGTQAGLVLRSRAFRFVFSAYPGSALALKYPGRIKGFKKNELPVQLAIHDLASNFSLKRRKYLPQTQAESAKFFGVSQPDISRARRAEEYEKTIETRGLDKLSLGWNRAIRDAAENKICLEHFPYFYGALFRDKTAKEIESLA